MSRPHTVLLALLAVLFAATATRAGVCQIACAAQQEGFACHPAQADMGMFGCAGRTRGDVSTSLAASHRAPCEHPAAAAIAKGASSSSPIAGLQTAPQAVFLPPAPLLAGFTRIRRAPPPPPPKR